MIIRPFAVARPSMRQDTLGRAQQPCNPVFPPFDEGFRLRNIRLTRQGAALADNAFGHCPGERVGIILSPVLQLPRPCVDAEFKWHATAPYRTGATVAIRSAFAADSELRWNRWQLLRKSGCHLLFERDIDRLQYFVHLYAARRHASPIFTGLKITVP